MAQPTLPDHGYFDVIPCPDHAGDSSVGELSLKRVWSPQKANQPLDLSVQLNFLCPTCLSVSKEMKDWFEVDGDRYKDSQKKKIFQHHRSGRELQKSQMEGCHMCTLIWSSFCSKEIKSTQNPSHITQRGRHYRRTTDFVRKGTRLTLQCVQGEGSFVLATMHHPWKGSFSGEFIDVRITEAFSGFYGLRPERGTNEQAVPDDNLASPILTSSKSTLTHAQLLLKECVTSHSKCGGSSKSPNSSLPTRLIHIDEAGPQKIRLQSSHYLPPDTRYTTLSYCWGPTKPGRTRLEQKCVAQFTAGIPFPQLPKTIREAIHFTHALGIRYIWVDLLCIIQDSEEDMAKEITAMHKIFENGYLNLSALSSDCMDKGLYAQRNPLQYCPVVIGSEEEHTRLQLLPNDDWAYNWPVHLRGWIFQERIFSRRTLYFGPYLVWVCQETSRHEFQRDISPKYNIGPRFRYLLSQPSLQESEKWAFYLIWHEILEAYFFTNLGRQTDRLLAIQGLIADIEERTKWKNVMGLWEPFLLQELLWSPRYHDTAKVTGLRPSWSWIYVQGSTRPLDTEIGMVRGRYLERHPVARFEISHSLAHKQTVVLSVTCLPCRIIATQEQKLTKTVEIENWPSLSTVYFYRDSDELPLPTLFLPLGRVVADVVGLAVAPSTAFEGMYIRVGLINAVLMNSSDWDKPGEYGDLYSSISDSANWTTIQLV